MSLAPSSVGRRARCTFAGSRRPEAVQLARAARPPPQRRYNEHASATCALTGPTRRRSRRRRTQVVLTAGRPVLARSRSRRALLRLSRVPGLLVDDGSHQTRDRDDVVRARGDLSGHVAGGGVVDAAQPLDFVVPAVGLRPHVWRLAVGRVVHVTLIGDFVASGNDCLAHCGVAFHAPAWDEKRARDPSCAQARTMFGTATSSYRTQDSVAYCSKARSPCCRCSMLSTSTSQLIEDVPADREGATRSTRPAEITLACHIRHRELRSSLGCLWDLPSPNVAALILAHRRRHRRAEGQAGTGDWLGGFTLVAVEGLYTSISQWVCQPKPQVRKRGAL